MKKVEEAQIVIYITGDCHAKYDRFNRRKFPEQKELTKKDYVMICGDFGFWDDSKNQEYWLDWLEDKPFTTLWVDGNHENFDLLETYPVESWDEHGERIQRLRPSVIHMMRGEVYRICGKTFFTFGGAESYDLPGGLLDREDPHFADRKKAARRQNLVFRVNHESWWEQELPSEQEIEHGRQTLARYNNQVDYIITHCAPAGIQRQIVDYRLKNDMKITVYTENRLTAFLEEVRQNCRFDTWFFGHYHDEMLLEKKFRLVYKEIIPLNTAGE